MTQPESSNGTVPEVGPPIQGPGARASGRMRPIVVAAALIVCVALAATACGGSSKPAVCDKRDNLQKAVDNLLSVNPVSDGISEVRSRLADVQNATGALGSAAGDQFGPQVKALRVATAKVSSDVQALTGSDKAAAAAALLQDIPAVRTSFDELVTAVGAVCK